jgi:hypothetical protein
MYQEEEIKKYIKKVEEQVSKLQQQQIPKEEKPKVLH